MELKKAPQQLKAKEIDRENFRIFFVLSTGAVDRHGEVIDQAGWKLENYLKNPVVLWGHDQSQFPIGKMEDLAIVDGKLQGWVKFAYAENPQAAIAFELCAGEFLNAGSVGFMNMKWMYDEANDMLTLLENELYEFSIVNVPANPEALSKAMDTLKAKGVEKRVLDGVDALRKEIQERSEKRFEGLGAEVKTVEEVKEPEAAAAETVAEPSDEEVKGAVAVMDGDKKDLEAVMKAIEVLAKTPATKIELAVKELIADESKDADTKVQVETTPAPLDRKVRKHSINEINRVIRNLAKGSK